MTIEEKRAHARGMSARELLDGLAEAWREYEYAEEDTTIEADAAKTRDSLRDEILRRLQAGETCKAALVALAEAVGEDVER